MATGFLNASDTDGLSLASWMRSRTDTRLGVSARRRPRRIRRHDTHFLWGAGCGDGEAFVWTYSPYTDFKDPGKLPKTSVRPFVFFIGPLLLSRTLTIRTQDRQTVVVTLLPTHPLTCLHAERRPTAHSFEGVKEETATG